MVPHERLKHAVPPLGGHATPHVGVRDVVEVVVGHDADQGRVGSEMNRMIAML